MHLIERLLPRRRDDAGFTLIELVVTISIVGVILVAVTGVVIQYLKTETATAARFTESNTVQLAAAYWERDASSAGLRSSTYDAGTHSFPLTPSVDYPYTGSLSGAGCTIPGTGIVAFTWGQYDSASSDTPTPVTVTYSAQSSGVGANLRYNLVRSRCRKNGATWTRTSSSVITQNLVSLPTVTCSSTCNGAMPPKTVSMVLTSSDPNNDDGGAHYSATLTGERRQTCLTC